MSYYITYKSSKNILTRDYIEVQKLDETLYYNIIGVVNIDINAVGDAFELQNIAYLRDNKTSEEYIRLGEKIGYVQKYTKISEEYEPTEVERFLIQDTLELKLMNEFGKVIGSVQLLSEILLDRLASVLNIEVLQYYINNIDDGWMFTNINRDTIWTDLDYILGKDHFFEHLVKAPSNTEESLKAIRALLKQDILNIDYISRKITFSVNVVGSYSKLMEINMEDIMKPGLLSQEVISLMPIKFLNFVLFAKQLQLSKKTTTESIFGTNLGKLIGLINFLRDIYTNSSENNVDSENTIKCIFKDNSEELIKINNIPQLLYFNNENTKICIFSQDNTLDCLVKIMYNCYEYTL